MTRVGLVLGAGGVVGQAYHAGVLAALENDFGFDPRKADVIVGTSAGSITGTLLRLGVKAEDLAAWTVKAPLSGDDEVLRQIAATPVPELAPFRPTGAAAAPDAVAGTPHGAAGPDPTVAVPPFGGRHGPGGAGTARHRRAARRPAGAGAAAVARARAVDLRRPPARRSPGRLRPPLDTAGAGPPGGRGVLRRPGVLRAGPDRRPHLRRRRGALADQRRAAARLWAGPGRDRLTDERARRDALERLRGLAPALRPAADASGGPSRRPGSGRWSSLRAGPSRRSWATT